MSQRNTFFCAFLLVCLIAATQANLLCYKCNSKHDEKCAVGHFKAKDVGTVNCMDTHRMNGGTIPAGCSVVKYMENNKEVTERGCFEEDPRGAVMGRVDECMEWKKNPTINRFLVCFSCKKGLCNAAPALSATIGTMIALISLSAVLF